MSENKIKRKFFKLTVLGDSDTGKTAIINSFLGIEYDEWRLLATIGRDKFETTFKLKDNNEIRLIIRDTPGAERFETIALRTLRNVQGVILVFDLTNKRTFGNINNWLNKIKENTNNIHVILFGNKCDLDYRRGREVTKEEAEQFAKENNLKYFETSVKKNINIKEGFEEIVNKIYEIDIKNGFEIINLDEDLFKKEDESIKKKEESINKINLNNNQENQKKQKIFNYDNYPFNIFDKLNKYFKY